MVKYISKFFKYILMRISYVISPPHKRKLEQLNFRGYEILAFINEDVGRQLKINREYERVESEFLTRQIIDGDVVFDVGGNIGYYALMLADSNKSCKVHTFEPVPINYDVLCLNLHLNGISNVITNQFALGSFDGESQFSHSVDGAFSSIISVGRRDELKSIKIKVRKLDSYIEENKLEKVDIVKVDIEGAEELFINGANLLLQDEKRKPRVILMELLDINFEKYGTSVRNVIEKMTDYGYSAKYLDSDGELIAFETENFNVITNVLFFYDRK